MIQVLADLSKTIPDPSFRVYLILLGSRKTKDISKETKDYLEKLFLSLQIAE
jgi:hypothetical protein